jgi:hypothetical protein
MLFGPITTPPATLADPSGGTFNTSVESNAPVSGRVVGVGIRYNGDSPSASGQVTVRGKGPNPLSVPIITIVGNTSQWFYPHTAAHGIEDGAEISDVYGVGVPVDDIVEVIYDTADENDYVEVFLMVE